jgi:integrase
MASICKQPNGRRTIQLSPSERPGRPKIALGKISQRDANTVRVHLEAILTSEKTGEPIPPATAQWVAGIPATLRDRLAGLGLVAPSDQPVHKTVDQWAEEYEQSRSDLSESGRWILKHTRRNLAEHFTTRKRLAEVTIYDARQFQNDLHKKHKSSTARRRMRAAKEIFARAVDAELIDRNPFAKVKLIGSEVNPDRMEDVPHDVVAQVIAECPDLRWKLIFGLARYAALRCPSELVPLRWGDVDWDKRLLHVQSPKTAKSGKASRLVPICPELYTLLDHAYHDAEERSERIVPDVDASTNLRTTAKKLIVRAGVTPWTRLFQNMRRSCADDWGHIMPQHVATTWAGHSVKVAEKHYWQVRDSDYATVTGQPSSETPKKRVQDRVQTVRETGCHASTAKPAHSRIRNSDRGIQKDATRGKSHELRSIHRVGLEPTTR